MPETRQPRHIASAYCTQYHTNAEFFIQDQHPSGLRHLVVHYEDGGYDARPDFAVGIPADWTKKDVSDLLPWPMKDHPGGEYPAREGTKIEIIALDRCRSGMCAVYPRMIRLLIAGAIVPDLVESHVKGKSA
jgi:hypothetical protein